jgi:hypothetical protein
MIVDADCPKTIVKHAGCLSIEQLILAALRVGGDKTIEQLTASLPNVSWTQVFLAIDRLSRSGRVILRRTTRGDYQASLNRTAA